MQEDKAIPEGLKRKREEIAHDPSLGPPKKRFKCPEQNEPMKVQRHVLVHYHDHLDNETKLFIVPEPVFRASKTTKALAQECKRAKYDPTVCARSYDGGKVSYGVKDFACSASADHLAFQQLAEWEPFFHNFGTAQLVTPIHVVAMYELFREGDGACDWFMFSLIDEVQPSKEEDWQYFKKKCIAISDRMFNFAHPSTKVLWGLVKDRVCPDKEFISRCDVDEIRALMLTLAGQAFSIAIIHDEEGTAGAGEEEMGPFVAVLREKVAKIVHEIADKEYYNEWLTLAKEACY